VPVKSILAIPDGLAQGERQALQEHPPEVELPTGSPLTAVELAKKVAIPAPAKLERGPEKVEAVERGAEVPSVAAPAPKTLGPAPAAKIATPQLKGKSDAPSAEAGEVRRADPTELRQALSKLPLHDSELKEQRAVAPELELEGNADPARIVEQREVLEDQVLAARKLGAQQAATPAGEHTLYPEVERSSVLAENFELVKWIGTCYRTRPERFAAAFGRSRPLLSCPQNGRRARSNCVKSPNSAKCMAFAAISGLLFLLCDGDTLASGPGFAMKYAFCCAKRVVLSSLSLCGVNCTSADADPMSDSSHSMQSDDEVEQTSAWTSIEELGSPCTGVNLPGTSETLYCPKGAWGEGGEISSQFEVDALAGVKCVNSLLIYSLESLDLTPLKDLEVVCSYLSFSSTVSQAKWPFPNLRIVGETLEIDRWPDADLTALAQIERMGGLSIRDSDALVSMNGLQVETDIDEIRIRECPNLESIASLPHAAHMRTLQLYGNAKLHDLSGFSRLQTAERISLTLLPALVSAHGFENVTAINGLDIFGDDNLESLAAFESLRELDTLGLGSCAKLSDLQGLDKLNVGPTWVSISELDRLSSLSNLALAPVMRQFKLMNLAELRDLSPLRAVKSTDSFVLANLGNSGMNGELEAASEIREIHEELVLHNLPWLTTIDVWRHDIGVRELVLTDLPALTDLTPILDMGAPESMYFGQVPAISENDARSICDANPASRCKYAGLAQGSSLPLQMCPWLSDGVCDEDWWFLRVCSDDEEDCSIVED
jgi:hypothetical protein